jgi:hypothetical protein
LGTFSRVAFRYEASGWIARGLIIRASGETQSRSERTIVRVVLDTMPETMEEAKDYRRHDPRHRDLIVEHRSQFIL